MSCNNHVSGRAILAALLTIAPAPVTAAERPAVAVQEDENSFTLSNGVITARVSTYSGSTPRSRQSNV